MHTITTRPVLILCAMLAACATSTDPGTTTWQASLTPVNPHDRLIGAIAVLSQPDRLTATIQIKNAAPGAILTWQLGTGTCDQTGDLIGGRAVYPTLTADSLGTADAIAVVDSHLQADGRYQAAVFDTTDALRACGELLRQ
jgi:hypothetical protein